MWRQASAIGSSEHLNLKMGLPVPEVEGDAKMAPGDIWATPFGPAVAVTKQHIQREEGQPQAS